MTRFLTPEGARRLVSPKPAATYFHEGIIFSRPPDISRGGTFREYESFSACFEGYYTPSQHGEHRAYAQNINSLIAFPLSAPPKVTPAPHPRLLTREICYFHGHIQPPLRPTQGLSKPHASPPYRRAAFVRTVRATNRFNQRRHT